METLLRWWPIVVQFLLLVFLTGVLWTRIGNVEDAINNDVHPVSEAEYAVVKNEIAHIKKGVDRIEQNVEKQDEKLEKILEAVND